MPFPGIYYYQEKESDVRYGPNPPGTIDVPRFISSKPCWRKPGLEAEEKQKTILLYDWAAHEWSNDKLLRVRDHLRKLIEANFPVYLYLDNEFVKLTDSNLYLLSMVRDQEISGEIPDTKQIMEKASVQLKVPKDQLFCLGHPILNALYDHGVVDREYAIDLLALGRVCEWDVIRALEWIDRVSREVGGSFILKQTMHANDEMSAFIQAVSSKYPVIKKIQTMAVDFSKDKQRTDIDKSQINVLELFRMNPKAYASDIDNQLVGHQLLVPTMRLNECMIPDSRLMEKYLLIKANVIEVKQTQLGSDAFISLVDGALLTRHLSLEGVTIAKKASTGGENEQPLPQLTMPNIDSLSLCDVDAPMEILNGLLFDNPDIHTLTLSRVALTHPDEVLYDQFKFEKLEALNLSDMDIHFNDVCALLAAAPNLKKFTLNGSIRFVRGVGVDTGSGEDTISDTEEAGAWNDGDLRALSDAIDAVQLEELEELQLSSDQIDEHILYKLIKKMPNLKKLSLRIGVDEEFNFKKLYHLQLRELKLDLMELGRINANSLVVFFKNSHQLTKLSINFDAIQEEIWKEVNLSRIVDLTFKNFNPESTENLGALILRAASLERLSLCSSGKLDVFTDLKIHQSMFPHLRQIKLEGYRITASQLVGLIKASPNLSQLKLEECQLDVFSDELRLLFQERNIKYVFSNTLIANFQVVKEEKAPKKIATHDMEESEILDANTDPKVSENITYQINQVFFSLHDDQQDPSDLHYRFSVYNSLSVADEPCAIESAFRLSKSGDVNLTDCDAVRQNKDVFNRKSDIKPSATDGYFYGKQTLNLTEKWQALPSLSPNERLMCYHVDPESDVEIKYSKRDGQYYIRSMTGSRKLTIDFIVSVPKQHRKLPREVEVLVAEYNQFGENKLEIKNASPTGRDYLEAISSQKTGACRHRMVSFKERLDRELPSYRARMVTNETHAFVEVLIDDQWVTCDLGGYPAEAVLDKSNDPRLKSGQPTETLIHHEEETELVRSFLPKLRTWEKNIPDTDSVQQYSQQQVNGIFKKRLLKLSSREAIQSLRFALESHCKTIHRPVYYIHSPDDLVCNAPYITRDGQRGILHKGPGGPLYDFLTAPYDPANPPVLIVNYDTFDPDDMVRLNSLIDEKRRIDGIDLPDAAIVIGMINPSKPNCYEGSDFYSRFDHVETCPLSLSHSPLPIEEASPNIDAYEIDLHHQSNWKERLLGRWQLRGDQLIFIEGEFSKAIQSGKPIHIKNGMWNNPEFQRLWQEMTTFKKCQTPGGILDLARLPQIIQSEGDDWVELRKQLEVDIDYTPASVVLNPTTLTRCYSQYRVEGDQLIEEPGLIAESANKTLTVTLTRELSRDEWAALLAACHQYHVQLHCYPVSGVKLPTELAQPDLHINAIPRVENPQSWCSHTSDQDALVKHILSQESNEKWLVLDVSECHPADLLVKLSGEFNPDNVKYTFTETEQVLINALRENKNIILKGRFSAEMEDALTAFILRRQSDPAAKGRVHIIHTRQTQFIALNSQSVEISLEEKNALLAREYADDDAERFIYQQKDDSYVRLHARVESYRSSRVLEVDPWQGMYRLPTAIHLAEFNPHQADSAAAIVSEFNQQRLDAVNSILQHSPYAYLAGLTAVGKTTFVEKILGAQANVKLFRGESTVLEWARDQSDLQKILFIDEANITSREWSEFEGLFNDPPGILINGEYIVLSSHHKVVFAGNPLSYGGERKLPPLFARHGNSVVFDPLPEAFIYNELIKPIFAETTLMTELPRISDALLSVYRYLCLHSRDEVLISPREIQMMALMVRSHAAHYPDDNPASVARHYAYLLANQLVPAPLRYEFDMMFKPATQITSGELSINQKSEQYLVTPSRVAISHHLQDLLKLRELRVKDQSHHDAISYGGLGGMVVEGEPGIGKSEVVIESLVANGYHEAYLDKAPIPEKPFYRLPINLCADEKKRLLLTAFHQGAVVVIDEINSAPMMERLLNDLLMGKTSEGERPTNPGFLVIGTQNPASMAGRRQMTTALARRMTLVTLPPYTREEMVAIIERKKMPPAEAKALVIAYEKNLAEAKQKNLTPAPTFRDLLKAANRHLKKVARSALLQEINDEADYLHQVMQNPAESSYRYFRILESIGNIKKNPYFACVDESWLVKRFVKALNMNELASMKTVDEMTQYLEVRDRQVAALPVKESAPFLGVFGMKGRADTGGQKQNQPIIHKPRWPFS